MTTADVGAARTVVEDEVRELVRRRGLDPLRQTSALRRLIDDVLVEYDERRSAAALPAVGDSKRLAGEVYDAVAGFGPLQQYLDDPSIEEIWINDPSRVFVARRGIPELTTTLLTTAEVHDLVERMLKPSGRRVDLSTPFVDAMLPDGSRLHVVIPDVTREHWAVNIRKFVAPAATLDDLVSLGTVPPAAVRFLEAATAAGLNVLVSGGTQSGKTTFLNCLAAAIPGTEHVVTCEEVFELRIPLADVVGLQVRQPSLEGTGEIPLRRLIKEALRMRPSRLIVGEVRQEECLDLLIALNSGVPGMCTLHANSAREALTKMCTLPLLAGENVSSRFVVPTVAASIDLVVHLTTRPDGRREVVEILGVSGRLEGEAIEAAEIFVRRAGELVRGGGWPPHPERFAAAGLSLASILRPEPDSDVVGVGGR